MKKELEYIIKQAQKPDTKVPLLTKEELKNIVDDSIAKKQIPNKIKRRIIMSGFSALIIAGALFLSLHSSKDNVNQKDNKQETKQNVTEKKSDNRGEIKQTPVMLQDVPKYSTSTLTNTETNSNQDVIIRMVPDSVPQIKKDVKNYMEPIKVNGIKFLELTDEEFEKVVPNTKLNDTTFAIYQEIYLDDKQRFKIWRLDTLGYKIEEMPILVKRYVKITPHIIGLSIFLPYKNWKNSDYSRTINVGYSFVNNKYDGYISLISLGSCPLFHFSNNNLYREFDEFDRQISKKIWETYQNKDTVERNRLHQKMFEYNQKLFSNLIPIKRNIPRFGKGYCILWFVPNEEFLAALPERYSVPLRKELEIKEKFEKQLIQLDEACKGLSEQETYFDICKTQSGAIESITAIPNKAESNIQVDIILKDSRKLYISLYDLTGKLVKKFESYALVAGKQSLNLNIGNIQNGIFLLSVQSDKSEVVVQKVFIL
ncbi:MAG: T9SS type A sorting domain-containing protein [FCB group bacterium]|jgi:hypothetical protein